MCTKLEEDLFSVSAIVMVLDLDMYQASECEITNYAKANTQGSMIITQYHRETSWLSKMCRIYDVWVTKHFSRNILVR